MNNSYTSASRPTFRAIPAVGIQLVLLASLSACSPDAQMPEAETAQASQSTTRPSISAAELSNDGVNSISFAQAVAAGDIALPQPSVGGAPQTSAANPVTTNPLAVIPADNTENTIVDETVSLAENTESQEGTDTQSTIDETAGQDELSNTETANTDGVSGTDTDDQMLTESTDDSVAEASDNETGDEASVDTVAETDTDSVAEGENIATDNSENESEAATKFTSHTSPGFNGEVLEDSIKVTWNADPDARGYNVYKQAEYITTVFATEFIDTEVFDRDYYYEIQAFDFSDTLYYIATGLTVSARTLGKIDPNMPIPDPDLLKDYELVFSDEFNTDSLDATKWNTSYLWGDDLVINSEEQHYVDIVNEPDFGFNPFTFDGNNLTINSIETPPELLAKANNQPYLSGVITSYDAFKFTYGYVETRAKVTFGRGYWPAFWLLNAYYVDDKPEIDIMEFIGDNQDVVYHTYHYYDSEGNLRSTKSEPTPGIDYTNDFHTYATEWRPGTIVFYVDGIEVHRITDAKVSKQDMYVIANTALGGWWAGSPDSTTPFPGEFTLDYIRVYQKNGPFDDFLLDDGPSNLPFNDDIPGQAAPNHRPTPEQWPEGYPDGL